MSDLISRRTVINTLNVGAELLRRVLDDTDIVGAERAKYKWGLGLIESYISDMKKLPSVQSEHKTGHWIPVTNGRGGHQCDKCGSYAPSYQSGAEWLSNFCPECNADMRGETE